MMKKIACQVTLLVTVVLVGGSCQKHGPLTEEKAAEVVRSSMFSSTPAYAEVPQRVSFGPKSPKDDYDGLALRTLRNLERAGLLSVEERREPDGTETYLGKVTRAGFRLLGTVPSARGPAFRARIADKRMDGIRDFVRHPNDPNVGRAEILWHYENPTPLYPLFETKIDKPLNHQFVSLASFYWDKGWKMSVTVQKEDATPLR